MVPAPQLWSCDYPTMESHACLVLKWTLESSLTIFHSDWHAFLKHINSFHQITVKSCWPASHLFSLRQICISLLASSNFANLSHLFFLKFTSPKIISFPLFCVWRKCFTIIAMCCIQQIMLKNSPHCLSQRQALLKSPSWYFIVNIFQLFPAKGEAPKYPVNALDF